MGTGLFKNIPHDGYWRIFRKMPLKGQSGVRFTEGEYYESVVPVLSSNICQLYICPIICTWGVLAKFKKEPLKGK